MSNASSRHIRDGRAGALGHDAMGMHAQSARAHAAAKTPATGVVRTVAAASKEPQGRGFARAQAGGGPASVAADRVAVPPGQGSGAVRLRVAQVRHLHRTQGNRAVERWIREAQARQTNASHDQHDLAERTVSTEIAAGAAPSPLSASLSPPSPALSASPAATFIQREAQNDSPWWKAVSFGETVAYEMADQFAPQLTPILRKGPEGLLDWLKDRAAAAATAAFNSLMNRVQAIAGIGSTLSAQFTPMLGALQDAAAKIGANDCSPISQAADKIEKTAESIITPVVAKLQPVVKKVQDVLNAAWDKIGAPIWQWIKDYAGQQWDLVKSLASWVWQLGEPVRSLGKDAWTWLKNKLGIGDGPEGENGILQWLQSKFELVWSRIKATLEPFSTHLGVVRSALAGVAQTVTGPISQLGTLAAQVGKGIGWLATNLGKGKTIAEQHGFVEKTLIPPLIDGLRRTGGAVMSLAGSMTGALGKVASGLNAAGAALANSPLSSVASAVQWIAGEADALTNWATEKLQGVATWLQKAIGQFEQFLHGLAEFLSKVGGVVSNVWSLPMLLAGRIWNAIPACIRDPVVDFVIPIILRQIELFADLARDSETWQKTKAQIMAIVRRVFVDHDLPGAVKASFNFVLRVLNIPEDMLGKVAAKAMAAWDIVSKAPLDFIKNTVRSLGHGFKLLWTNIGTHLEHGIEGWLFGELTDKNIRPPQSWSDPKAIFGFVLDVLGLSMSHVTDLLKKRINPTLVDKVQAWAGKFARAWDWITSVIDTSKSVAENTQGLMAKAKDFGKSILTGAVEWIVGKVATELATLAAAASASGGLSEVIDVARRMYKAILTAKRWAGRILQMASDTLDRALDIASGNVTKVGGEFENIMDRAMPVVIGFLADQVGLGGIGAALRDIIDKLRDKIDDAILWLIDKVKGGIEGLLSGFGGGTEEEKQQRLRDGVAAGVSVVERLGGKPIGKVILTPLLGGIRLRYRLSVLEPVQQGKFWAIHGEISRMTVPTSAQADESEESGGSSTNLLKAEFKERIFTVYEARKFVPKADALLGDLVQKGELHMRAKSVDKINIDDLYAFGPNGGKLGFYEGLESRRSHYGYQNLQSRWFRDTVLTKAQLRGLATHLVTPPPYPPLEDSRNNDWLRNTAEFWTVDTPRTKVKFTDAVMGHSTGASNHWNDWGHMQTKSDNKDWNRGFENYRGPEDSIRSARSGSKAPNYRIPYAYIKSNPEWL